MNQSADATSSRQSLGPATPPDVEPGEGSGGQLARVSRRQTAGEEQCVPPWTLQHRGAHNPVMRGVCAIHHSSCPGVWRFVRTIAAHIHESVVRVEKRRSGNVSS